MIALITPTGGRKRQIELCAQYMKAQTYKGDVLWVIVDDCVPETTDFIKPDFRKNWFIRRILPIPHWRCGDNTQSRNLQAGLDLVKFYVKEITAIFIIEDDDYYHPTYLDSMSKVLRGYEIAGEMKTIYYHTALRIGIRNQNARHSSLFQTAFNPIIIPQFEQILEKNVQYIDMALWRSVARRYLFEGQDLAIGIKGLPGRQGIGNGHNLRMYSNRSQYYTEEDMKRKLGDSFNNYI